MFDKIRAQVIKFDYINIAFQLVIYLSMIFIIFKYGGLSNSSMRLAGLLAFISYIIVVVSPMIYRKLSEYDDDCYEFYILPASILSMGILAYSGYSFYHWELSFNMYELCIFNVIYLSASPVLLVALVFTRVMTSWES